MILAMACFTIRDMISKYFGEFMPISQILIIIGSLGTSVFFVIALFTNKTLFHSDFISPPFFTRFICELFASIFFVISIVFGSLAITTAIMQTIPIFIALGSIFFFEKKVRFLVWLMILCGLFGVILIIKPGTDKFDSLTLLAVLSVLCLTGKDLSMYSIKESIPPVTLCFWGFLALLFGGILCVPFFGVFEEIPLKMIPLILLLGSVTPLAYLSLVFATRGGDISVVSSFRYSRLIFSLVVGVVFFHEKLDLISLIGCIFIISSGMILTFSSSSSETKG